MVTTEVMNGMDGNSSLKEGNTSVYRDIKDLEPNKKFIIEIDPNATYREYVVVSTPSGSKVFVTSDDCIDNSIITIVDRDGKYVFTAVSRGGLLWQDFEEDFARQEVKIRLGCSWTDRISV